MDLHHYCARLPRSESFLLCNYVTCKRSSSTPIYARYAFVSTPIELARIRGSSSAGSNLLSLLKAHPHIIHTALNKRRIAVEITSHRVIPLIRRDFILRSVFADFSLQHLMQKFTAIASLSNFIATRKMGNG